MKARKPTLTLHRLGIDTYKEAVIYMRKDCHVCQSEGFGVHAVFAEDAYDKLAAEHVEKVVTCNTIAHTSNAIDVSTLLLQAL